MTVFSKFVFAILLIGGLVYAFWPLPAFPRILPNAIQSIEPADTENINRRGYFTDSSRYQIMVHFKSQLAHPLVFRLNHPPEDAGVLIRDQTKSNFLEEFAIFGKGAWYINGYIPVKPQEQIYREGIHYLNKINVRVVYAKPIATFTWYCMCLTVGYLIFLAYKDEFLKT